MSVSVTPYREWQARQGLPVDMTWIDTLAVGTRAQKSLIVAGILRPDQLDRDGWSKLRMTYNCGRGTCEEIARATGVPEILWNGRARHEPKMTAPLPAIEGRIAAALESIAASLAIIAAR